MRTTWSVALVASALVVWPSASNAALRSEKSPPRKSTHSRSARTEPFRFGTIELKGSYPEGAEPTRLFGNSVETLSRDLGAVGQGGRRPEAQRHRPADQRSDAGWAKVNELRTRSRTFAHKGKRVIAYLDSATTHDYLVAAACDQVIMPESGELAILGLRAEVTFYQEPARLAAREGRHAPRGRIQVGRRAVRPHRDEQGIPSRDGRDPRRLSAPDRRRNQQVAQARPRKGPLGDRRGPLHGPARL